MAPIRIDTLTEDNLERAVQDIGLERDQYISLLQIFFERVYEGIRELEEALTIDDLETARRSIHTIKGTSQNMRLNMIASPAGEVEKLIRSDKKALALANISKIKSAMDILAGQAEHLGIPVEGTG